MVHGTREHAERLRSEVEAVLPKVGLRLNAEKTRVCHIDEGFDFSASASSDKQRGVAQGVRLHLTVEEVTVLDHGQGEGDHQDGMWAREVD